MAASDELRTRLFSRVLASAHHNEPGVDGDWGFTCPLSARRRALDALESAGRPAGFGRRHFSPETAGETLAQIAALAEGLARTEALLADATSKELLLDLLCLRVLGEHHARMPVTQRAFRKRCARIEAELREAEAVAHTSDGAPLNRYRVEAAGGTVRLIGLGFLVEEFFEGEQYALRRGAIDVRAEAGDVVIDAGGGWGETALYFADAVGSSGRVLSFEFVPDNLRLFDGNLELNPRLRDRVEIVPHPSWEAPGRWLGYTAAGGQTSVAVATESPNEEAVTESIDHVCAERGIDRVDFIKLDVEGAELATLRGAQDTIARHRPKLALSVYHRLEDFVSIPAFVDGLDLGYQLYLDHRWPGPAETILFAQPA